MDIIERRKLHREVSERRKMNRELPSRLYRGFLMLTSAWPGQRVAENSLLIKLHQPSNPTKLPLVWCGGPNEMPALIEIVGKERAIYGLRGTYEFVMPTEEVILKMGNYYANELFVHVKQDSYVIAGNCAAAYLALEIAQQLQRRGAKVSFLGLVERDVTEQTFLLKVVRKIFKIFDRLGTIAYELRETWKQEKWLTAATNSQYILSKRLFNKKVGQDPREQIKYEHHSDEKMYEIQPYAGKIDLFFLKWSVFGFYQIPFFQKFWYKNAKNGATFTFISGVSHEYPDWFGIVKLLQEKLKDSY